MKFVDHSRIAVPHFKQVCFVRSPLHFKGSNLLFGGGLPSFYPILVDLAVAQIASNIEMLLLSIAQGIFLEKFSRG